MGEGGGWRGPGSDLIRQVSDLLACVVQHIPHTEYGAEGVLLRVVFATLNLLARHRGGKIPPEAGKKENVGVCDWSLGPCVTHLVTSKSGKRMLFLMKMVKLFTSSMGSLRRTREEDRMRKTSPPHRSPGPVPRVPVSHQLLVPLSRTPALDLTPAGAVGGVIGLEADSRDRTCVTEGVCGLDRKISGC